MRSKVSGPKGIGELTMHRALIAVAVISVVVAASCASAQEWSQPAYRLTTNVGFVKQTATIDTPIGRFNFYHKERDNDLVAVGENADGRLQVFYRSQADGHVYTQWQNGPNQFGSWSTPLRVSDHVDYLAVGRNQDGRLQLFMKGSRDGHLYTRWQNAPSQCGDWSGPAHLVSYDVDHFAVGQNADGRLQVFMRGSKDGHLYTRWQVAPNASGSWNAASHRVSNDIGNDPGAIAVARNADGRLQVFMRGSHDGHLYTRWQVAPNAVDAWVGSSHQVSRDVSNVVVAENADGRLQVFMRGSHDGHLYTRWQVAPNAVDAWIGSSHQVSRDVNETMAAVLRSDGRLQVFMRGSHDGHLYTRWQNAPNDSGSWVGSSQRVTDDICTVAVGRNADGRLQVFVMGDNDGANLGHLYSRWHQELEIKSTGLEVVRERGPSLKLIAHLEGIGDVHGKEGEFIGTRAESRRLEGFQIDFDPPVPGLGLKYMAHLEGIGDVPYVTDGQFVGTREQSRRLEGFAIELTGPDAEKYDVVYCAHLEGHGDSAFYRNGEFCGSRGESRRVEGILVRVQPK